MGGFGIGAAGTKVAGPLAGTGSGGGGGVTSIIAGSGIGVSGATGDVTVTNTGVRTVASADGSIAVTGTTAIDLSNQTTPIADFYTSVVGAAVTKLTLSGLNAGAVGSPGGEGSYEIEIGFINAGGVGPQTLEFLINDQNANLRSRNSDWLVGSRVATDLIVANSSGYAFNTTVECKFLIRFEARSGRKRVFICYSTTMTTDANNDVFFLWGEWTDTATNVTSIGMRTSLANGIGIGSYIKATPTYSNA
jgi:hypothetical protein